jgi:hypothetical protein
MMEELLRANQDKMDACITEKLDGRKEMTACHEATKAGMEKIEPNPGMVQSIGSSKWSSRKAAVMLVGGLRRQRRDWNLAEGCHQKPKGRIQVSCESWKRSTFTGRKVSHRTRVAWRKIGIIRKDCTRTKVEQTTRRIGPRRKIYREIGLTWSV